jgi:hypothetical protein
VHVQNISKYLSRQKKENKFDRESPHGALTYLLPTNWSHIAFGPKLNIHRICYHFTTAKLWPRDNLLLRHFDPVTIYYCDTLTPWQFTTVTLWPRDNLLLRHSDPKAFNTASVCPPQNLRFSHKKWTSYHSVTLWPTVILASPWLWHFNPVFLVQSRPAQPVTKHPCHDFSTLNSVEFLFCRIPLWSDSVLYCGFHPYMKNGREFEFTPIRMRFSQKIAPCTLCPFKHISSKVFLLFLFIKGPNIQYLESWKMQKTV